MAFDTGIKLEKLDPKTCPKVPPMLRGKNLKGLNHDKVAMTYLEKRNAWAVARNKEGHGFDEIATALGKSGHPITGTGIAGSLTRHGLRVPEKKTGSAKTSRVEVTAVAALINDIVEKRCEPLAAENRRLKKVEKQFNDLKKLLARV